MVTSPHSDAARVARSVDEARSTILEAVRPLPAIKTPLADALGLALAEQLIAVMDSPPFATAAMDGFAVRAMDTKVATSDAPVRLPIAGVQPAGDASTTDMPPGTAVRIMTGAPCPAGADAVVPYELTTAAPGTVLLRQPVPAGANIRPQGEEYRASDELLVAGTLLRPAELALLAANGQANVAVRRPARVAVVAAGNELRAPGKELAPGQIWDSNSIMVSSLCRELGAEVAVAMLVSDREDEIVSALEEAERAAVDLILTVGGISAGDYDHLKHVLTMRGDVELWDVAMRPGRPLAFGRLADVPVIGLPGNPAAAFVSFHQFVRPLLARLMGRSVEARRVTATTAQSFQNRGARRNFIRVEVAWTDSGYVARSAGSQGTASILSLARANGLLVIPEGVTAIEPGEMAQVELL